MTTPLSISEKIEQALLEEGNNKTAVTRRFNKVAGLFSQSDKSPWDFTLKTNEQKRLAYAAFLLSKFGSTIPTDKRNKTAAEVLFTKSDLGRVANSIEKALQEEGATYDSVMKAYDKGVALMERNALRKSKAAIANGDKTKDLTNSVADKLEAHLADIVKSVEADDAVARIKAWVAKYEAQKVTKAVTIQQSEPELINS